MSVRFLFILVLCPLLLACHSFVLGQGVPPEEFDQFLEKHCFECHDDAVQKGELNLLDLEFNLSDPVLMRQWVYVFDRIHSGEMPPRKKLRPDIKEKAIALQALKAPLIKADRNRNQADGRVKGRRLTRREYQNTVQDLLGIAIPLEDLLPEDAISHFYDTEASAQQLSHFHLEQYLTAADTALHYAFERALAKEVSFERSLNSAQICEKFPGNYRGPEKKGNRSIFWPYRLQFYGRTSNTKVPESGWYNVTLKGIQAVNDDLIWGLLESGHCASNAPTLFHVGLVEATKKKKDQTFRTYIQKDHRIRFRPAESSLEVPNWKTQGGRIDYRGNQIEESGYKGISIEGMHIQRVFPKCKQAQVRSYLFGDQRPKEISKLSQTEQLNYIKRRTRTFASRAFRRPVSAEQIQPYFDLVAAQFDDNNDVGDTLFLAYRAILCSPRFLNFNEKPGELDQHSLANRISYMLWSTAPDWKLRTLANEGKLTGAEIEKTVIRLLDDKRARKFTTDFVDQWLNLKEIDATAPDRRFYTYDPIVHHSILKESHLFFDHLVKHNLSVKNFIHSDFSYLNERLFRFYQFKNKQSKPRGGFQKIDLGYDPRGGLLTHASVLKVTADGTTTSPIVRGVYINERILGRELPPPPPGIPAVEPDIRGAVSIRDQVEKHSNSENCAACHRKIDPAGFALEAFNPIGLRRSHYGKTNKSVKVDPSGITPDGQSFQTISEWKQIYTKQPKLLATAFANHLVSYGTGAAPSFSDREEIEKIVKKSAKHNYGVRSLIIEVINSQPFRTK